MDDRIRFHLDEHIDPDIARAIRKYGVDVTTTADAKLSISLTWRIYRLSEKRIA